MWLWGTIFVVVGAVVALVLLVDRRRGAQGEARGSDLPGTTRREKRAGGGGLYGGAGGMGPGGGGDGGGG